MLPHNFCSYILFELLDPEDEATMIPKDLLAQWQSVRSHYTIFSSKTVRTLNLALKIYIF